MRDESEGIAISRLQWAHHTLMVLIETVQANALVGDQRLVGGQEAVVLLSKGAVALESVIQENIRYARRRRDDTPEGR